MKYNVRKPNKKEEQLKKTIMKEAESCRAQLLVRQPFIGMLAMRLDLVTVIDSRLPTACTDGNTVYFNAHFLKSLSNEERIYLLAHEIWHCVFLHFKRKGNRELERFNYAADLEVDFMLEEQGLKVDKIDPYKKYLWKGLSAEAIYELMEKKQRKNLQRHDKADVHIFDDVSETSLDQPATADQESKKNKRGPTDKQKPGNAKDQQQKSARKSIIIDDDYLPLIRPNTERNWRQWVISAAQQLRRSKGNLPAYLEQLIKDLYQPELSWKEILQQFASYCFGGARQWLPPNRRYVYRGLYLPSRRDEFLSIIVAIDTSGSTINDLPVFLAELKGIVASFGRYNVTIIECDTEIKNVRNFSELEPFEYEEFDFHGFGGTDFRPVFEYIGQNVLEPKLLIFMTDGYGKAPLNPPEYPVLWVITSEGEAPADWGWKARLKQDN